MEEKMPLHALSVNELEAERLKIYVNSPSPA
jgi:hypothetical protein